jgi:hypothetical protein
VVAEGAAEADGSAVADAIADAEADELSAGDGDVGAAEAVG